MSCRDVMMSNRCSNAYIIHAATCSSKNERFV